MTQHLAICRYLGKKAGLAGKDDWEALKIDEIVDVINELRSGMSHPWVCRHSALS